jgi:hypothetical protein
VKAHLKWGLAEYFFWALTSFQCQLEQKIPSVLGLEDDYLPSDDYPLVEDLIVKVDYPHSGGLVVYFFLEEVLRSESFCEAQKKQLCKLQKKRRC